ncbi:MAG: TonB-dependent receptor, partial [Acidobacteria bacterium]
MEGGDVMLKLLFVFAFAAVGGGQQTGSSSLEGQVLDPSGAVVAAAYVRLLNTQTTVTFAAVTDNEGRYAFTNLPPGPYRLVIESPGFQDAQMENLNLEPGATKRLPVRLSLAAITDQVTVSATRQEGFVQSDTGHTHETLEIHEVRESSAKDVGEALMRLDGVWKIRKAGIANDIVVRGFQQDNLNVLIDGARIYGACPNNMDPPAFHVDFSEVEKVEVSKGPFDMRNQGGFGGAVNIINKTPGSGFHVTPNVSTGSFGFFNPSLTASASNGKVYALAGHSFRRSDPYQDAAGKRMTEYANYRPDALGKEAFHIHTGWFKFGAEISPKNKISLAYTRQQGGEISYPYLQMDALYDNADRMDATYTMSEPLAGLEQLRVQGYFTQVHHWMTDQYRISSLNAPRPYGMATYAGTRSLGGHVDADLKGGFATGVDFYIRDWNAVTTLRSGANYTNQASMPDVRMTAIGLYGQHTRSLFSHLRLTAGFRLDTANSEARSTGLNPGLYNAYKAAVPAPRRDTFPSGSLRLAYDFEKFELFGAIGHTARFPDPQERYFGLKRMGSDWVGNPNLDPSRNTEFDLGVSVRTNRFVLRPTLFYSNLSDFILVHNQKKVNPVPGIMNSMARSYAAADARLYGGEVMASVTLTDSLIIRSGLSYARGSKDIAPQILIFDPDLAEIAPVKFRTIVRYGRRMFFSELEGMVMARQDRADSDLGESVTPGYGIVNVKVG